MWSSLILPEIEIVPTTVVFAASRLWLLEREFVFYSTPPFCFYVEINIWILQARPTKGNYSNQILESLDFFLVKLSKINQTSFGDKNSQVTWPRWDLRFVSRKGYFFLFLFVWRFKVYLKEKNYFWLFSFVWTILYAPVGQGSVCQNVDEEKLSYSWKR